VSDDREMPAGTCSAGRPRDGVVLPALPEKISITRGPACGRLIFRGRETAHAIASHALQGAAGVQLPVTACQASVNGETAALWLGPDEWLLLGTVVAMTKVAGTLDRALDGHPHALTDVSDRQIALNLAGPLVVDVLSAGCPLDLDAQAFPVGNCTRTVFAKSEIVLWRTDEHEFRIEIARSMADYLAAMLTGASKAMG
jgi:sarcosine oxidase, subunit gamma